MIAVVVLIVVAATAGTLGATMLSRAGWVRRAPVIGLVVWQSVSVTILASVLLAAALVALPPPVFSAASGWLGTCLGLLEGHYAAPFGWIGRVTGAVIGCVVLARAVGCTMLEARAAGVARRVTRGRLALLAAPRSDGVLLLEDDRPAAYCVPGHRPVVVLTTGAERLLRPEQRIAVLTHERAHLRARHHWAVLWASGLNRAFGFVPAFAHGAREVELLVEMHADDAAARASGRQSLAEALVRMASGPAPTATLAAHGADAVTRVRRLLGRPERLGAGARVALTGLAAALLLGPVLIGLLPAIESTLREHCAPYEHACDVPGRSDVALP